MIPNCPSVSLSAHRVGIRLEAEDSYIEQEPKALASIQQDRGSAVLQGSQVWSSLGGLFFPCEALAVPQILFATGSFFQPANVLSYTLINSQHPQFCY